MPGIDGTPAPAQERRCPWCSTAAPAGATHCASCGASLAERESLGGMVIPGLTEVDPAVREAELRARSRARNASTAKPHVLGPIGGVAGGPLGLAIGAALDSFVLGRVPHEETPLRPLAPHETSLRMADSLDGSGGPDWDPYRADGAADAAGPTADPWGDLPEPSPDGGVVTGGVAAGGTAATQPASPVPTRPAGPPPAVPNAITGRPDTFEDVETMAEAAERPLAPEQLEDPWADLPVPSIADQVAGTEYDPWAAVDQTTPSPFDPWAPQNLPGGANDPWSAGGGPWSQDPWATGGGPWSQDPWADDSGKPDDSPG
jgi:hypothetical protein